MNYKIVTKYALILFIATAAAAFPFGFIAGFLNSLGKTIPTWVAPLQGITVLIAIVSVFANLGKLQPKKKLSIRFLCSHK